MTPHSASSGAPFLSSFPFVSSASSSSTAVSWSLPTLMTCSAPSLASLALPLPSAPPPSSVLAVPSSPHFVPSAFATSGSGVLPSDSAHNCFVLSSGTSYADFADPCSFRDGDDSLTKGEKDLPALDKSKSSRIFMRW